MWPKKPEEKAEDFAYADDPEFSTIRRKLARWAADNVRIIKDLKPPQPPGFNNRLSANWKLLLQIAQHAGGGWPEQDHEAQRIATPSSARLRWLDRGQSKGRLSRSVWTIDHNTQLPPEVFLTTSADVPPTLTSFPSGFDPEESRASSTAGTMRLCNQSHRRGVCTGAMKLTAPFPV